MKRLMMSALLSNDAELYVEYMRLIFEEEIIVDFYRRFFSKFDEIDLTAYEAINTDFDLKAAFVDVVAMLGASDHLNFGDYLEEYNYIHGTS